MPQTQPVPPVIPCAESARPSATPQKRPEGGTGAHPPVPAETFRAVLGRFASGVAIATTIKPHEDGQPVGVTVNSFTSVSLDPPLVLFCLKSQGSALPAFQAARLFAINLLGESQKELSGRFARNPHDWTGLAWEVWETGAPVLPGSLATLDCRLETIHAGGDHEILIGRVLRLENRSDEAPLVYHRGKYAWLAEECL